MLPGRTTPAGERVRREECSSMEKFQSGHCSGSWLGTWTQLEQAFPFNSDACVMFLSHKPPLGAGLPGGWAWPGTRAGACSAGQGRPAAPEAPGLPPEPSQVLLTSRTAHVAQSRVSIAVVPKHKPEQRDCRVSRKHWARWDIQCAPGERAWPPRRL